MGLSASLSVLSQTTHPGAWLFYSS
eukprot:COSAG05_NODE_2240_length_3353_cov_16.749232_5_plen_24_part_01